MSENQPDTKEAHSSPPGEVNLDKALRHKANEKKEKIEPKKKKLILLSSIAASLILVLLVIYSCQPPTSSRAFGVCSTFLELQTPYPHTIEYSSLISSRTAVRIYYSHRDPFGQKLQSMIECKFGPDEKTGMKLISVEVNRKAVNNETVLRFNEILPAVLDMDLYLVRPPHWENPLISR